MALACGMATSRDALARGPRRDAQRDAISRAMGPVWEANHVWLIFVIVLLFTGFPRAFQALGESLFVPFHLALAGITLRGEAFVFRAYGPRGEASLRRWGALFGVASAVTPVLLGMCLGAVSSGRIRVGADGEISTGTDAWRSPVAPLTGLFALALCAYLAAVFLTVETDGELREKSHPGTSPPPPPCARPAVSESRGRGCPRRSARRGPSP